MLDNLPNEIIHHIGEYSVENSMSNEASSIHNSAVFFYFNTLSYLSSHMYFRIHDTAFWERHPIAIVLKNRSLLSEYNEMKKQNQQSTEDENGEENLLEEEVPNSQLQLLYIEHLIATCQFPHVTIVAYQHVTFVHDLFRLLFLNHPDILQRIRTLSVSATVLSLRSDLVPIITSECSQLENLELNCLTEGFAQTMLPETTLEKYRRKLQSITSVRLSKLTTLSLVLRSDHRRQKQVKESLNCLCEAAQGLESITLENIDPNTVNNLGTLVGSTLQHLKLKLSQFALYDLAQHLQNLETLDCYFTSSAGHSGLQLINSANCHTLKHIRLGQKARMYSMLPVMEYKLHNLESLVIIDPSVKLGAFINEKCGSSLQELRISTLDELKLDRFYNIQVLELDSLLEQSVSLLGFCNNIHTLSIKNAIESTMVESILSQLPNLSSISVTTYSDENRFFHTIQKQFMPKLKCILGGTAMRRIEKDIEITEPEMFRQIERLRLDYSREILCATPYLLELELLSCRDDIFSTITTCCPLLRKLTVTMRYSAQSPPHFQHLEIFNPMKYLRSLEIRHLVQDHAVKLWLALCLSCPALLHLTSNYMVGRLLEECSEMEPNVYTWFTLGIQNTLPIALNSLKYLDEKQRTELTDFVFSVTQSSYLSNIEQQCRDQSGPRYLFAKAFVAFQVEYEEEYAPVGFDLW